MQTPENITGYRVINTENATVTDYTEKDPRLLKLYIPRFVNGESSMIKTVILTAKKITDYSNYNVYATYDQGSIKVQSLKEKPLNVKQFFQLSGEFFQKWSGFMALIALALGVLIPLIVDTIRSRRSKGLNDIIKYTKIIDSIYNTSNQSKERLKRLDEFHKEITEQFRKGIINDNKYDIFSKKISIYIAALEGKNNSEQKMRYLKP